MTAHSRGRSSRPRIFCRARRTSARRSTSSWSSSLGPFWNVARAILFGLEQAGYHDGLEVADGGGAGFQADVDLVRVRQDVAEGMPPAGLASLPGELDEPVSFGAGDAEPPEPSEGTRSAPQALVPRRMPREQQKHPIEVMHDPDVLRRLRDRLRDLSCACGPRVTPDGVMPGTYSREMLAVCGRFRVGDQMTQ